MIGLAIALEAVGISGIIAGIAIECVMHADFALVIITVGSGVIAAGSFIWSKVMRR